MDDAWNGFPPTSSGWKESTCRKPSSRTQRATSDHTERKLPRRTSAGAMRTMSARRENGTSPSSSNPFLKMRSDSARKRR